MMNCSITQKIRTQFNRCVRTYDQNCDIQCQVCDRAIELLLRYQNQFEDIADFACGTGESTLRLVQAVKYKNCYATDFAENLLFLARKKFNSQNQVVFVASDLNKPVIAASCLDLIFCNMALQWSTNLAQVVQLFYQCLKQQGILLFSMPIEGNFPEINLPFKPTLPSHETIIEILQRSDFIVLDCKITILSTPFASQFELLKSLKAVGANYCKSEKHRPRGLSKLNIEPIFNAPSHTQLTYKNGIYLARKQSC